MPEYLGDILVVTQEELIPRCFPSYEALKKKLQRYSQKAYGIKRAMSGGNGRRLLVEFDSLDKENQEAIGDPRIEKHPLDKRYKTDNIAVTYYNDFTYPDGS